MSAAAVPADELSIGYVDVQALIDTAPQADLAREELAREFAPRERELEQVAATVRRQEYEFLGRATQLSAQQRRRDELEIRRLERELRRMRDAFLEDLNARRRQEFGEFRIQVTELIQQFAKAEDFDLVFIGGVLYASETTDMTHLIRRLLERQFSDSAR